MIIIIILIFVPTTRYSNVKRLLDASLTKNTREIADDCDYFKHLVRKRGLWAREDGLDRVGFQMAKKVENERNDAALLQRSINKNSVSTSRGEFVLGVGSARRLGVLVLPGHSSAAGSGGMITGIDSTKNRNDDSNVAGNAGNDNDDQPVPLTDRREADLSDSDRCNLRTYNWLTKILRFWEDDLSEAAIIREKERNHVSTKEIPVNPMVFLMLGRERGGAEGVGTGRNPAGSNSGSTCAGVESKSGSSSSNRFTSFDSPGGSATRGTGAFGSPMGALASPLAMDSLRSARDGGNRGGNRSHGHNDISVSSKISHTKITSSGTTKDAGAASTAASSAAILNLQGGSASNFSRTQFREAKLCLKPLRKLLRFGALDKSVAERLSAMCQYCDERR
jgi:hypothetical protein